MMTRQSIEEQARQSRMQGVADAEVMGDAPVKWLCDEIHRVATALASEEQHRQYRLGLVSGYVAVLTARGEHVALIEVMRHPEVFQSISQAKREAGAT